MRQILAVVTLYAFVLGAMPGPAWASSPHFISASASVASSGVLTATFKEAGLGTTVATESITLSVATATSEYFCINGGGKHPSATNKQTASSSLQASGNFPVRNGQTTGSLSVGPVGPQGFSCPNGQTLTLISVSYTGVQLTGLAGDTANISGTFSACLDTRFPGADPTGVCP